MKTPLKASFFLKPKPPEVKKKYLDLDGCGYGHQEDQLLSPKLAEFAKLGDKYESPKTQT
jgi:hypothetical protein